MYATFYGLDELPFELSPDPKYLLLTARHREALANLEYGIAASKSLTLLLGPAGTGKTTLIQAALQSEACRGARIVHLVNPTLTRKEFVEFLARSFDLSPGAMGSKATLLAELERELLAGADQGRTTALVIDEAQCLSGELLEEIRLLSNIETPGRKLLPLVLAGQPELSDRLRLPSLVQLKQRVALRCTLGLLDAAETRAYITSRLKVAGANGHEIFTPDALQAIYERSGGVPRTISAICDNALVNGFAAEATVVGVDIIREVCDDFDLSVPFSESAETTRPRPVVAETKAPPIAFRHVSPAELSEGSVSGTPSPRPAEVPGTDLLDARAPETPRAPAVTPVTPLEPLTPIARFLAAAAAVCVVGLLVVIVGIRWRRSETPVQVPQSKVAAITNSQVSPLATSDVAQGRQVPSSEPSTATPPAPDIRAQQALAVDTKSPLATRKPAKARVERKAKAPIQKDARDKRPAAHSRAAGSGTPKPSSETARPSPEGALAAVTPQPFTRPTTVAPPVQIEQPPAGPAARATAGVPAAAPAAPTVVSRSDEQRILGVLGDYRAAYEQLNPQAVETVWPSVDTRALARAFNGLSSQSIGFDRCNVSVAAATARAACQGDVEYVKRVGGRTQSARREWVFDLQKSEDGAWRIKSLTAR